MSNTRQQYRQQYYHVDGSGSKIFFLILKGIHSRNAVNTHETENFECVVAFHKHFHGNTNPSTVPLAWTSMGARNSSKFHFGQCKYLTSFKTAFEANHFRNFSNARLSTRFKCVSSQIIQAMQRTQRKRFVSIDQN